MPTSKNPSESGGSSSRDDTAVSPEANIKRNPQTGQALSDPSVQKGDPKELSDGGAKSSRHTGEDAGRT